MVGDVIDPSFGCDCCASRIKTKLSKPWQSANFEVESLLETKNIFLRKSQKRFVDEDIIMEKIHAKNRDIITLKYDARDMHVIVGQEK